MPPPSAPIRGLGPTIVVDPEGKYNETDNKENTPSSNSCSLQPRPANHQHPYRNLNNENQHQFKLTKNAAAPLQQLSDKPLLMQL